MVGLLRWTFVIPVLADTFVRAPDEATKAAAVVAFRTIHQFGGVILQKYLDNFSPLSGQYLCRLPFARLKLLPRWINLLGIGSSLIYFLAQAELFATVMPGFPMWTWLDLWVARFVADLVDHYWHPVPQYEEYKALMQ